MKMTSTLSLADGQKVQFLCSIQSFEKLSLEQMKTLAELWKSGGKNWKEPLLKFGRLDPALQAIRDAIREVGIRSIEIRESNPPATITASHAEGSIVLTAPEKTLDTLSSLEVDGLIKFAKVSGRTWKKKLRDDWAFSSDPELVSVRNKIGPSGLAKISISIV